MCLWQQDCFGNHLGGAYVSQQVTFPLATVTGHQERVPADPRTPNTSLWSEPPSTLCLTLSSRKIGHTAAQAMAQWFPSPHGLPVPWIVLPRSTLLPRAIVPPEDKRHPWDWSPQKPLLGWCQLV